MSRLSFSSYDNVLASIETCSCSGLVVQYFISICVTRTCMTSEPIVRGRFQGWLDEQTDLEYDMTCCDLPHGYDSS